MGLIQLSKHPSAATTLVAALLSAAALAQNPPTQPVLELGYLAVCINKKDSRELRRKFGQAHLEYLDTIKDKILIAGPSQDPETGNSRGSVLLYRAASLNEAKTLLEKDPIYQVFERCTWDRFSQYVGVYVHGWKGSFTPRKKPPAD